MTHDGQTPTAWQSMLGINPWFSKSHQLIKIPDWVPLRQTAMRMCISPILTQTHVGHKHYLDMDP